MKQGMLDTIRNYFATQPVERAWLFGSYSRGEERADTIWEVIHGDIVELKSHVLRYLDE